MSKKESNKVRIDKIKIRKLFNRLALFFLTLLFVPYFFIKETNKPWEDLFYSLFPEITSALLFYLIFDYFFIKYFLSKVDSSHPDFSEKKISSQVSNINNAFNTIEHKINKIESRLDNIGHSIFTTKFEKFLINGTESNETIKWESAINDCDFSLLIVVNYFDSWITKNKEILIKFLRKKESRLTVIIPNIGNSTVMSNLEKLMPKHNQSEIIRKINDTERKLNDLVKKEKISKDKLQISKCNINFNFTMQIFDNKYLYFSMVEMNRDLKFKSPFFIINLSENKRIKEFFEKEISGLKDRSI